MKLKLVVLVKGEARMKSTRDTLVEIVAAEPKKYSEAELGRIFGVSRQRVHNIVKKVGLHDFVRPAYPARNKGRATKIGLLKIQLTRVVVKLRTRVFEFYNEDYSSLVEFDRACSIPLVIYAFLKKTKRGDIMEKALRDRLLKFTDEMNWSGLFAWTSGRS